MPAITLSAFNHLPALEAGMLMRSICASRRWAERLTAARPYRNQNELLYTAHRAWWALGAEDWREVFASHGSLEQRLALDASEDDDLEPLLEAVREYRERFGFPFVAHLGGETPSSLLPHCRQRLDNEPGIEVRTAAEEQARINRIGLEELFRPDGPATQKIEPQL